MSSLAVRMSALEAVAPSCLCTRRAADHVAGQLNLCSSKQGLLLNRRFSVCCAQPANLAEIVKKAWWCNAVALLSVSCSLTRTAGCLCMGNLKVEILMIQDLRILTSPPMAQQTLANIRHICS